ncbi:MAG: hypothetical protein LC104_16355 [Bacteroidales bacterium]|nr:hypothetical protein [Bacteroidales bacterium]
MHRRFWSMTLLMLALLLLPIGVASAQYPAPTPIRPNAGFTMVPAGAAQQASVLPPAPPISTGVHPHWGPTWTNTGAGAIPAVAGMQQPKYGWDAYPYPGKDGRYFGLHQGCANPLTCGNFWSDKTFIFGSCRQYFGHGRGCGGWLRGPTGTTVASDGVPVEATTSADCPSCSKSYWSK